MCGVPVLLPESSQVAAFSASGPASAFDGSDLEQKAKALKEASFFNAGKAPNPCMRVPCGFPFEGLNLVLEEQHRTDLMPFRLIK